MFLSCDKSYRLEGVEPRRSYWSGYEETATFWEAIMEKKSFELSKADDDVMFYAVVLIIVTQCWEEAIKWNTTNLSPKTHFSVTF